jgi:hypothetical protein
MSDNQPPDRRIRLSAHPADDEIVDGIRRWIELLANDDYEQAMQAIKFEHGTPDPEAFRSRVENFFQTEELRAKVNPPNENVLQHVEVYRTGIPDDCQAVIGFYIPLVNGWGIWTTFYLRAEKQFTFFEFEIFHL